MILRRFPLFIRRFVTKEPVNDFGDPDLGPVRRVPHFAQEAAEERITDPGSAARSLPAELIPLQHTSDCFI
jgi:hypothetical protein